MNSKLQLHVLLWAVSIIFGIATNIILNDKSVFSMTSCVEVVVIEA